MEAEVARDDPTAGTWVVGDDTPGDKKDQTYLAMYEVDGVTIEEVLDVPYCYVPKSVRYGVIVHDSDGGVVWGNGWPGEFELPLRGLTD